MSQRSNSLAGGLDPRNVRVELVRRLETEHPRIAAELSELLATSISDLDRDTGLLELLHASVESNVSTIFHMLANDIGLESLKPPTAAIEYAVRLAHHDVQISSLTRAYYLGQSMLIRIVLEEMSAIDLPDGTKLDVVRAVADSIHGYIDWMLQQVTEAYTVEHRRWWSARGTANTALVLRVLRGEAAAVHSFSAETRYQLERHHLAMVVWAEDSVAGVESQRQMDQLVRRMATALGSIHAPLTSAVDESMVWAWVAMPTPRIDTKTRQALDLIVSESAGLRASLGTVGFGLEGFRRSKVQAEAARQVALASQSFRDAPVVADSDPQVALAALLLKDRAASLTWMRRVLGSFADGSTTHDAIRQTLSVFLASGQNYSVTAEQLGVHRNTVRHRVAKFEAETGSGHHFDPLEIALALRIRSTLGE